MRKIIAALAVALLVFISSVPVNAQQAGKVYRIGWLFPGANIGYQGEAFQQGLREFGYVEGKNIVIEWRFAKGKMNRFPGLATELVQLGVDAIVTVGVSAIRAAKQATSTIPIIMADSDDDPVRQGLIASYARPGGNVTGLISFSSELAGKRLEFLRETVPDLSRLGILWRPRSQAAQGHFRETEAAARALGVEIVSLPLPDNETVENIFQTAVSKHSQALVVIGVGGMGRYRTRVVDLAAKMQLPVMYTQPRYVRQGGFMSYAANIVEMRRRAAIFVDKIFKGANPAELPVERPDIFELVVNLKTANTMGVTFPRAILLRATEVIE